MSSKVSRRGFIKNLFAGGVLSPFLIKRWDKSLSDINTKPDSLKLLKKLNPDEEKFWELVRMQFPLTSDRRYFNTSGLGASPRMVIDTVTEWTYKLETISETGHGEVHKVHLKAADFFNVTPEEIAITRNTTEGMNIIARELPLEKGDEVLMCTHEHPGGSIPWLALMKDKGIKIKLFEPDYKTGEKNLEIIEKNITKKTKVVSIDHIPCTTGTVFPAKEIVQLCRSKNIFICFDGAHPPGQMKLNLGEIDPDYYATSGHKWLLAPKETGLLYINKKLLDKTSPQFAGAYSDKEFVYEDLILEYKNEANREEYGTRNTPLKMGLGAAFDFLNYIGIENIEKRSRKMATYLKEELLKIPRVELMTPLNPKYSAAIVTFKIKGKKYSDIQKALHEDYKCRVRGILEHDLNGIRISNAIYNNFDEIDYLLSGIKKIAKS